MKRQRMAKAFCLLVFAVLLLIIPWYKHFDSDRQNTKKMVLKWGANHGRGPSTKGKTRIMGDRSRIKKRLFQTIKPTAEQWFKMPQAIVTSYIAQRNNHRNSESDFRVRHIAFLKVHKAGSTTIQNILYRFGLARNLSFVIPIRGHYIAHTKDVYNAVLPSRSKSQKYDILCNHAVFNPKMFNKYMYDDAVYVAIVREPLDRFISAALYYRYVWPTRYLKHMSETTFILDLMRSPAKYEPMFVNGSRTFNILTQDFGFLFSTVRNAETISDTTFDKYLDEVDYKFDIVLIMERFDESLILLKRLMSWKLSDIVYMKSNAGKIKTGLPKTIDTNTKNIFRHTHRFDYKLYDRFTKRFDEKVKQEERLNEEVQTFKDILKQVQDYCSHSKTSLKVTTVPATEWNEQFDVSSDECDLMMTSELNFFRALRKNQRSQLLHLTPSPYNISRKVQPTNEV